MLEIGLGSGLGLGLGLGSGLRLGSGLGSGLGLGLGLVLSHRSLRVFIVSVFLPLHRPWLERIFVGSEETTPTARPVPTSSTKAIGWGAHLASGMRPWSLPESS